MELKKIYYIVMILKGLKGLIKSFFIAIAMIIN
jgi:hypothetical protein